MLFSTFSPWRFFLLAFPLLAVAHTFGFPSDDYDYITDPFTGGITILSDIADDHPIFNSSSGLVRRQAGGSVYTLSDPHQPPTLFYYCLPSMFEICENINAWILQRGQAMEDANHNLYTILHYEPTDMAKRRNAACGRFSDECKKFYACDTRYPKNQWRDSCDEFPFASSTEGGKGAFLRCVSQAEQTRQGGINGMVGQYAGAIVNGVAKSWKDQNTADQSFAPDYLLVADESNSDQGALARIEVTRTDSSVMTVTRNGFINRTPGAYNYDKYVFQYKGLPIACSCPSSASKDCQSCVHSRRPPFGLNAPDATPSNPRSAPPIAVVGAARRSGPTPTPKWPKGSVAGLMANVVQKEEKEPTEVVKRQAASDSCPSNKPDPEDEAQSDADEAQYDSQDAQDAASALPASNPLKAAAADAAAKAAAAATAAVNFLNSFVSASTVSAAVAAALAAANALDRSDPSIDSIYSQVISAANEASSVLPIVSQNPSAFPPPCASDVCAPSTTSDGGPTYIPPPPTTTTGGGGGGGGGQPTGTPGANGCIPDNDQRTWGVRIPHDRPSYSCWEDYLMTLHPIQGSDRFRLSAVVKGNEGYLSWIPQDEDCGQVNFIQLVPSSYDTYLTMEWAIASCDPDGGARIAPYWNGAPFPNFAIDLLNLLPVGSPDAGTLQCYEDSISVSKYNDQYYTLLAQGARDPVNLCSTAYPQSSSAAAAGAANAQPHAAQTASTSTQDRLLQQASQWPTRLLQATPAPTMD